MIYGSLTDVSVGDLFLAGILPGLIMGMITMMIAYLTSRRRGYQQDPRPFSTAELAASALGGLAAALVPIIIVASILTGFATATEVGVLAVLTALVLGLLAFGRLRGKAELATVVGRSIRMSTAILFIIATSSLFANVLTRLHFQDLLLDFLTSISSNPTVVLILIVISLLIIGCFIDVTPLLVMFAAALATVADTFDFDPVFFGVVVVVTATIGAVTPPVGGYLIIASGIARIPVTSVVRPLLPFWGALLAALVLLMAFPALATWLPSLIG